MKRALICAAGVLWACAAKGAPFADPTRPPDAMSGEAAGVTAGPRLESVIISPHRRLAVISGQQVRLGDKFGDGRVVRITPSEVAIRTGDDTEVFRLFPEVDKRSRAQREKRTAP
jgi:MSHA biogenesis protein MshK